MLFQLTLDRYLKLSELRRPPSQSCKSHQYAKVSGSSLHTIVTRRVLLGKVYFDTTLIPKWFAHLNCRTERGIIFQSL